MTAAAERWASYNDAQLARAVRPLCAELIRLAGPGRGRPAVDLGCGSGVETRALVAAGWTVTAVDSDATFRARISDLLQDSAGVAGVAGVVGDVRTVPLQAAALVHSSLTLPFVPPADFDAVWDRVRASLLPGGWLGVDLFGPRDDWREVATMSFHDVDAVERLVAGLEVVSLVEREWDAPSYGGPEKHWHVLQVIARQAGSGDGTD